MTEIKPCPLCGSPATFYFDEGADIAAAACDDYKNCGLSLGGSGCLERWNALPRLNEPVRKDTSKT